jgi:hypothetical protein
MWSFSLSSLACSRADVSGKASLAVDQNFVRCHSSLLAEHIEDYDGVGGNMIDDPPSLVLIVNPEFVALWANRWHWPGLWQTEIFAFLQSSQ